MPYNGLADFIRKLESAGELKRIKHPTDPELEITEITDRITKAKGPALLFENNGTPFPLLINAYGSDKRMSLALGRSDLEEAGRELDQILGTFGSFQKPLRTILSNFGRLLKLKSILPKKIKGRGRCQQVVLTEPDLSIFPTLKCWPYDGGKFITLPLVHTIHPVSRKKNLGMYRMQVLDNRSTGMHWHMHKTGANHYQAWKEIGEKMPVTVTLGGDPAYTYSATAPLPENVDEYMLAGFLRGKRVEMVKCLTNELWVPSDADIVIEGFVDPAEELVWEGPFGDHTGFYSLADWYPRFRITCITHRRDAVYPATIVGIPLQEDFWLGKATERIFLQPLKLAMLPEIKDLHLPPAGVAHNLVLVKIDKRYPGQGQKVVNSLFGAGQMMFSKYIVVISSDVDLLDYQAVVRAIFVNADPVYDFVNTRGPMDILDHSSDVFSFGGKLGIDATVKMEVELKGRKKDKISHNIGNFTLPDESAYNKLKFNSMLIDMGIPVIIVSGVMEDIAEVEQMIKSLQERVVYEGAYLTIVVVDAAVDIYDYFMVAWQLLGNSDPIRDIRITSAGQILIDARMKAGRNGFSRDWPNVVASLPETIERVDSIWHEAGLGEIIQSPSLKYIKLLVGDGAIVPPST